MATPTTRRFRVWYCLFLAAAIAGVGLLDRAIVRDDRPIAAALIVAGLGFAIALGAVQIIRILRSP